ncbi:hypothetical protein AB5I41_11930 [Sphingomonas sp. MMS24-JH45]
MNKNNGETCAFTYNGTSRQASFDQFDAAVDDENSPTSRALTSCLAGALVRNSPVDPLAGDPASLQSALARSSLDLTAGDSLIEEMGPDRMTGANAAGDPWIIGATAGFGNAGRFDVTKIDARIARGFRVFEGGRARLKFDLPISYTRINGTPAYSAQLGLGLELPVSPNFSIEPRVASTAPPDRRRSGRSATFCKGPSPAATSSTASVAVAWCWAQWGAIRRRSARRSATSTSIRG